MCRRHPSRDVQVSEWQGLVSSEHFTVDDTLIEA